jgi:hypothetical protein
MLRGLSTVSFFAEDVTAAQRYTELLGIEPCFVRPIEGTPAYVEIRIGDYQHELGIVDSRIAAHGRSDKAGGGDLLERGRCPGQLRLPFRTRDSVPVMHASRR